MKIFAGNQHARVVVPIVLNPVGVQVAIVGVAVGVWHIQVAVRVAPSTLCKISSLPPSFEFSQD